MINLTNYCRSSTLIPKLKQVFIGNTSSIIRNGSCRIYTKALSRSPLIFKNANLGNLIRKSTTTVPIRLGSNISKGQKAVGYWLLTCSGMVFVAVVLGISITYYVVLFSICTVLDEVIKKTVK